MRLLQIVAFLKSFFTLILKHTTYAFIVSFFLALPVFSLFLLWCSYLLLWASLCSRVIVSLFQPTLFLLHQQFINFFHFIYLFVFLYWRRVLWRFIFSYVFALVLPFVFCDPSLSSSCHCKFVSISLSFSPLVYIFVSLICLFSCTGEGHHCSVVAASAVAALGLRVQSFIFYF